MRGNYEAVAGIPLRSPLDSQALILNWIAVNADKFAVARDSERRRMETGVGILTLIDSTQLIDFISRQKHHKLQIRRSEVHGGYTKLRAMLGEREE